MYAENRTYVGEMQSNIQKERELTQQMRFRNTGNMQSVQAAKPSVVVVVEVTPTALGACVSCRGREVKMYITNGVDFYCAFPESVFYLLL